MDFLLTLLICVPYPAIGVHTARSVLHEARTQLAGPPLTYRRLRARTWLHAAAMIPLWPAVELIPAPSPADRSTRDRSA